MHLTTSPLGPVSVPAGAPLAASSASVPTPPTRWTRWWTSPIATFSYGTDSRVPLWAEASIPAERGLTGALRPAVTFGGATLEAAILAARALARTPVELSFSYRNGRTATTSVHPAIAVLRDAKAGVYWLAPLHTTVRRGSDWFEAPHAIDGAAFEGSRPLLGRPTVLSATRDMVAVVGATELVTPGRWTNAPDDSQID